MEKNVAIFWMRWKISGKFFFQKANFVQMCHFRRFKNTEIAKITPAYREKMR